MGLDHDKLIRTLRAQLKAAPRQTKFLGFLCVVLLGASLRVIFTIGPDTASASMVQAPIVASVPSPDWTQPIRDQTKRPKMPDLSARVVRNLFEASWQADAVPERTRMEATADRIPTDDASPELVLELTLTGETDSRLRYAVINGRRVRVGDTVSGWIVEEIAPGVVTLSGNLNQRVVVRMN